MKESDRRFLLAFKTAFPRERCLGCGQTDYLLRRKDGVIAGQETFEDVDPICEFCLRRQRGEFAGDRAVFRRCEVCGRLTKKGRPLCLGCYWKKKKKRGRG